MLTSLYTVSFRRCSQNCYKFEVREDYVARPCFTKQSKPKRQKNVWSLDRGQGCPTERRGDRECHQLCSGHRCPSQVAAGSAVGSHRRCRFPPSSDRSVVSLIRRRPEAPIASSLNTDSPPCPSNAKLPAASVLIFCRLAS